MLVANWPYTLLVIMPTNNQIMNTNSASAGPTSSTLIEKWGQVARCAQLAGRWRDAHSLMGVDELLNNYD